MRVPLTAARVAVPRETSTNHWRRKLAGIATAAAALVAAVPDRPPAPDDRSA